MKVDSLNKQRLLERYPRRLIDVSHAGKTIDMNKKRNSYHAKSQSQR